MARPASSSSSSGIEEVDATVRGVEASPASPRRSSTVNTTPDGVSSTASNSSRRPRAPHRRTRPAGPPRGWPGRTVRGGPTPRRPRPTVGQRRAERLVEHDGAEPAPSAGWPSSPRRRPGRTRPGPAGRGLAQRRDVVVVERPRASHEPAVDLRFGQRARERVEERPAQVEVVRGELEREERRLPLLELRRGGQHVVGVAGGLGHGDVNHDDELEGVERLAHAGAVGQGVDRVGALDEHRPEPVRVVREDLVGDRFARDEAGDDAVRPPTGLALPLRRSRRTREPGHAGVDVHARPARPKLPVSSRSPSRGTSSACCSAPLDARGPRRSTRSSRGRGAGRRPRTSVLVHAGPRAGSAMSTLAIGPSRASPLVGVVLEELRSSEALLDEHRQQGGEAPGVGAGTDLQVDVGQVGRLGAPRIDHDHRPRSGSLAIALSTVRARGKPWRLPRVLAEEHGHLGMFEVARRVAARAPEERPSTQNSPVFSWASAFEA